MKNLTDEVKTELLSYLKSDVLGLQELSEILHRGCFEQFQAVTHAGARSSVG